MQDALLPEWLPVLPGVEIAGRYLLAQPENEAGGDWYDAVGLADGRVALVVGDVVGHGVASAAAMGQLRAVVQERLTEGAGLAVDDARPGLVRARSSPRRARPRCASWWSHPATGRLEYCTAGHPPPLVVRTGDGRARYLPHTGAAPLATTGEMTVGEDHVDRGDVVVLYTDGLLARPGRSPAMQHRRARPGGRGCRVGATGLGPRSGRPGVRAGPASDDHGPTGYADDVAVLVAEITEPAAPLHLDLPADDDAVPARPRRAGRRGWRRCACATSTTSSCSTPSTSW